MTLLITQTRIRAHSWGKINKQGEIKGQYLTERILKLAYKLFSEYGLMYKGFEMASCC